MSKLYFFVNSVLYRNIYASLIILVLCFLRFLLYFFHKKRFVFPWIFAAFCFIPFPYIGFIDKQIPFPDLGINIFSQFVYVPMFDNYSAITGFAIAWIVGCVFLLTVNLYKFISIRSDLGKQKGIVENRNIVVPLVIGFFDPVILLPLNLQYDEKNMIIMYKKMHIKKHDTFIKAFLFIVLCFNWFNPLSWVMWINASRDIELICDYEVTKDMSYNERMIYAKVILKVACMNYNSFSPLAGFASQKNFLKQRIRNIKLNTRDSRLSVVYGSCLVIIVLFVSICLAKYVKSDRECIESILQNEHSIDVFLVNNPNIVFDKWYETDPSFRLFSCRASAEKSVLHYINDVYSETNSAKEELNKDTLTYLYNWLCAKTYIV